jgi:DNA replication protein DnaC
MDKNETIRLINFFNKIEIVEDDVTTPEEKENGQLVLIVTYKYEGKEYITNKLYYKNVAKAKDPPIYLLDLDEHKWPSNTPNIETICNNITNGNKSFNEFLLDDFLKKERKLLEDGKRSRYDPNLESNNHWHDIIKLIQAYIKAQGNDIGNKYFSRMVFMWFSESRHPLNKGYKFLKELQIKIRMVQQQLQHEKIKSLIKQNYQIILQGPPGTGKTRLAKELAYALIKNEPLPSDEAEKKEKLMELGKNERFNLIQFHPAYSYEDFVRGIVAETKGIEISYKVQDKVLAEMAANACKSENPSENPYVLIIDEINRANLPSVLGELIYALEYRGEEVQGMYGIGPSNDRKIILPKNLFIIGTMNTADRSVGNIDYALRRRFVFETVLPNRNVVSEAAKDLFKKVTELFVKDADSFENGNGKSSEYLSPDFLFGDVMLGHSYFIGDKETVENKLEHQVKPLLTEYVKDGVLKESATQIINALKI